MIFDRLEQLKRYGVPQYEAILKFISGNNCAQLPDGEMEIRGRELFVRIMSYTPKSAEENRFEIHRVYADLQLVVKGAEIMQIARLDELAPQTEYDTKGDYQFFNVKGVVNDLVVKQGEFAVFYPQEPHRPACSWQGHAGTVKKLVFKIKI